jgi:hypothetical protein
MSGINLHEEGNSLSCFSLGVPFPFFLFLAFPFIDVFLSISSGGGKKMLRVCLICIARREPSSNRDDGTATVEAEVVADLKEPGFHTRKQ